MDVPQWVQTLRVYDTVSGTTVDCAKSAHTGQTSHNGYKHWGYKTQYQGLLWTMPSQLTQEERHRRHTMDMNTEGVRHSIRDYRGLYQVSSHRRKGTDVTQWVWTLRFRLCQPLYYGLLLTYQVSSCRCVCIITRHVIQGHTVHQVKAFQFRPMAQATAHRSSWTTRHGHVTTTMRSRVGPLSHLEWVESLSHVSNIQLGLWAIQSGWGHWIVCLIYKWAPQSPKDPISCRCHQQPPAAINDLSHH